MTTEPVAPATGAVRHPRQFPELLPRDDMNNPLYLHDQGHQPALRLHLGNPATTIVLSEVPVGWNHRQQSGLLKPDLLVAFNVDRAAIVAQKGYSIDEWSKPPDFVLEVASDNNAENDYVVKRVGYAAFRVPEYWRFDHTGGQLYPAPLAGDRLVDGRYEPIPIRRTDDRHYWGRSDILNLDICWENGELRLWDPVGNRYLLTHEEERTARLAAEARIRQLEERLRRRDG